MCHAVIPKLFDFLLISFRTWWKVAVIDLIRGFVGGFANLIWDRNEKKSRLIAHLIKLKEKSIRYLLRKTDAISYWSKSFHIATSNMQCYVTERPNNREPLDFIAQNDNFLLRTISVKCCTVIIISVLAFFPNLI